MDDMVQVHRDIIFRLVEKYGQIKVDEVNDMSPDTTTAIIAGKEVFGVTDEQREIILNFAQWIAEHPLSGCTKKYERPKRILH